MEDTTKLFSQIPLESLFKEIPLEEEKAPVRWWSVKTSIEYLGVSERTLRKYLADGKLEYKHKIIKGRKRVFINSQSVIRLLEEKNWKKAKSVENVIGELLQEALELAEKIGL